MRIGVVFPQTEVRAGIAPLPIQRPIPIWLGVANPRGYRRTGRMGEGWFPMVPPGPHLDAAEAQVDAAAVDAGRDAATIGMEGRITWGEGGTATLVDHAERWRSAGATHIGVNTMGAGLGSVDGHLRALTEAAAALGVEPGAGT